MAERSPTVTHWQPIELNVSHSDHLALSAIGTQHAIGIDAETVRDKVEYEGLSMRFF